jgi:CHAT domain-containing protein
MMQQRGTPRVRELAPELAAERYRLEVELDRLESRLERVNPGSDPEGARSLLQGIRRVEVGLEAVDSRVRAAAPALAALNNPETLTPHELSAAFDPGDLLIAFAVDGEETLLFTLAGGGEPSLRAYSLPLGAAEIERRVSVLRALIARGREDGEVEPALLLQAKRLYELLLSPAAEELARAEQLLVVADGPLLPLPFGALVRAIEPLEYVASWKPLALAQSAAVFAELRRDPPSRRGGATVVAFGDPAPSGAGDLPPLPHSRREVESIARLFEGRATVFQGAKATEARAKATETNGGFVHFATHALLDRRFPLESSLVLSPAPDATGSEQDGLLQAWEIASQMQLDADLVTLSACNSALGGELAGEGILGLARAFQYAGARSLVVSQWPVSDRSTTELMERFYRRLLAGEAKSGALRAAQSELMRRDGSRHPFHWAAFQLVGDWR